MLDVTKLVHFSNEEEERNRQLAEHPYTAFARRQRQRQWDDPYRPVYHFTAPEGPMNDPNGLCYWQGRWHLFYQAFPPEAPIHWGHAVSEDLLHWQDLPYALHPDREEACWSGATLVEEDRVIAIFFGNGYGNIVAVSSDPLLLNWEKVGSIRNQEGEPYDVYDPCIWKQGEYYYSLSGRAIPGIGSHSVRVEYLFRSTDLVAWEYLHPLMQGGYDSLPGDDGACPYFWPIGEEKYILLHFSHISGAKYVLGTYDTRNQTFTGSRGGSFNTAGINCSSYGGVHAPSAAPDGHGNVVAVFHSVEGCRQELGGCYQVLGMPRLLSVYGAYGDELAERPAPDLNGLRGACISLENMALPAGQEVVLPGFSGNVMELQLEIAPADTLPTIDVAVLRSADGAEATHIRCYRQRGCRNWDHFEECGGWVGKSFDTVIALDNTESSLSPYAISRAPDMRSVFLSPEESLRLQIFVDKSIVEVFVNDRLCLATRAYPTKADSLGVSVRAKECDSTLLRAQLWDYSGKRIIGDGEDLQ